LILLFYDRLANCKPNTIRGIPDIGCNKGGRIAVRLIPDNLLCQEKGRFG
jgi:hypothetical protein